MAKETQHYASGVDEEHADKVSKAREKAEAHNAKALKNQKPWDTSIELADVDESTGKMFTIKKWVMQPARETVYVDGKLAKSAMVAGDVMAVTTAKPKAAPKTEAKGGKK